MGLETLKRLKKVNNKIEVLTVPEEVEGVDTIALDQAEEVAERTRGLLATRGWCLWKCAALNGDIIVIVRDELVTGYPERHPVYTDFELRQLCEGGASQATIRLVHEAKKISGATVTSVEDASPNLTLASKKSEVVNDGIRDYPNPCHD